MINGVKVPNWLCDYKWCIYNNNNNSDTQCVKHFYQYYDRGYWSMK